VKVKHTEHRRGCPDSEQLKAFLSGRLSEPEIASTSKHLSECWSCQSVMESLESASSKLAVLCAASPAWEHLREDGLARLESAAHNLLHVPRRVGAIDNPIGTGKSAVPRKIGQYELIAKLGEGGMGVVYRAWHVNLKRDVVLKLLPADRGGNQLYLARFYREMEAIGKINSPYVASATDAGEADGWHFLVMEYAPGIDVARVARARGPLSVADACEIIRQAALGLAVIDERGLVHRDIKPSNLFLTESGQVKILDLGLARLLNADESREELTGSQNIMGTVAYMAPEQIGHVSKVDIRADIYSLGCTLYKLLTGTVPFSGPDYDSPHQKMLGHLQAQPTSVQNYRNDIPNALARCIDRMLAKSPSDRYASPADVALAIGEYSQGHEVSTLGKTKCEDDSSTAVSTAHGSQETFSERTARAASRNKPAAAVTVMLVIIAVVGTAALAVWNSNPPNSSPLGVHSGISTNSNNAESEPRTTDSPLTDPNEMHEPEPVVSLPTFEQLDPTKIEPQVQYSLLNAEPRKLIWPDDTFSSQAFAAPLKQVSVISKGLALSSLGQMSERPYRFAVDIYQNEWKGNIGIFWGFERIFQPNETPQWKYQLLDFRPNFRRTRGEFPLVVWRNVVNAHVDAHGEIVHEMTSVASVEVPVRQWEEHQLEIRVDRDKLAEVRWRGQSLTGLCGHVIEKKVAGASYTGNFGIYVNGADGIFRNSHITWVKGVIP
jgi:serine/threonine protein kinase